MVSCPSERVPASAPLGQSPGPHGNAHRRSDLSRRHQLVPGSHRAKEQSLAHRRQTRTRPLRRTHIVYGGSACSDDEAPAASRSRTS